VTGSRDDELLGRRLTRVAGKMIVVEARFEV
jgi:hypothetical protein